MGLSWCFPATDFYRTFVGILEEHEINTLIKGGFLQKSGVLCIRFEKVDLQILVFRQPFGISVLFAQDESLT